MLVGDSISCFYIVSRVFNWYYFVFLCGVVVFTIRGVFLRLCVCVL